jgi:hypothetical protein
MGLLLRTRNEGIVNMREHSHDAIRDRAYALWEEDGRPEGKSLDHWAQAVRELSATDSDVNLPTETSAVGAGEDLIPDVPGKSF